MEVHWPKKGVHLFEQGGQKLDFAYFGWGSVPTQFLGYTHAYKEAADVLLRQALESDGLRTRDTHIFPILFLYRQYIELQLKWFILSYSEIDTDTKREIINRTGHNLIKIWNMARKLLIDNENKDNREAVEAVDDYIKQFNELDSNSYVFRYPINKELDPVHKETHSINLPNLLERMEELYTFFSCADAELSVNKDIKMEMLSYFSHLDEELENL